MKAFADEAVVLVRAGRGGDGCVSFRHEKYVPKGGPDGGDGGHGGDVVFVCDEQTSTLSEYRHRRQLVAGDGKRGQPANKTGHDGTDVVCRVPPGTIIYDHESGHIVGDLTSRGEQLVIAAGGKPGRGNARFKTSTNRAPRRSEPGRDGEERQIRLELKLIADVGLVGMPNAGKSTLISRVSAARPKIADYPFTTLEPVLGVVDIGDSSFVIADLPGLIAGAHEGQGLGHDFLRHVERTKILVHVVDLVPADGSDPVANYEQVSNELKLHDPDLANRTEVVAGNKIDLTGANGNLDRLEQHVGDRCEVIGISAVTGKDVDRLLHMLTGLLQHDAHGSASRKNEQSRE